MGCHSPTGGGGRGLLLPGGGGGSWRAGAGGREDLRMRGDAGIRGPGLAVLGGGRIAPGIGVGGLRLLHLHH